MDLPLAVTEYDGRHRENPVMRGSATPEDIRTPRTTRTCWAGPLGFADKPLQFWKPPKWVPRLPRVRTSFNLLLRVKPQRRHVARGAGLERTGWNTRLPLRFLGVAIHRRASDADAFRS